MVETHSKSLTVSVKPTEYYIIEEAAEIEGKKVAAFNHDAVVEKAKRVVAKRDRLAKAAQSD